MAEWLRFSYSRSQTTLDAQNQDEFTDLRNQADRIWEDRDLVIVDGICGFNIDTDNLVGIRMVVYPASLGETLLTEDAPLENSPLIKYSWFLGKGFTPFRIKNKITIPPQHRLAFVTWKERGPTAATETLAGFRLLVQQKR